MQPGRIELQSYSLPVAVLFLTISCGTAHCPLSAHVGRTWVPQLWSALVGESGV